MTKFQSLLAQELIKFDKRFIPLLERAKEDTPEDIAILVKEKMGMKVPLTQLKLKVFFKLYIVKFFLILLGFILPFVLLTLLFPSINLFEKPIPLEAQKKYEQFGKFSEGLLAVKLNGKWGYINENAEVVIPLKYDTLAKFSEGLAGVKLNRKWGYINEKGEVIIPLKYDEAWYFSDGFAKVRLNGKEFSINKKGDCVKNCP